MMVDGQAEKHISRIFETCVV